MDEAITLISEGCKLAKILESNLTDIAAAANQPDHLFALCTDIVTVFTQAKDNIAQAMQNRRQRFDPVQEWLSRSQMPAMDLLQAQLLAAGPGSDGKMKGIVIRDDGGAVAGGTLAEVVAPPHQRAAAVDGTPGAASRGGSGSSSSRRQRRRGDAGGGGRRVERVAAPEMGNTEIPPEDGFTWRKYGQKAILRSRFPRSYFRCTHQKLYNCPAKKQVQRQEDDPHIFHITYLGHHTCHFSSTAPSAAPPPPPPPPPPDLLLHHQQIPHLDLTTPAPVYISQWLSMDIQQPSGGAFLGPNLAAAAGPSSSAAYFHAPPQPVADLADVMFNSGGSGSNNSMDLIFPSMDHHHHHNINWDSSEKRN